MARPRPESPPSATTRHRPSQPARRRQAASHLGRAGRCSLALPAFRSEERAAAALRTAPAWVLGLELFRVPLVDDQAVVVVQLFAGPDISQGLDENPAVVLVGLAVGIAGVVDPAR